MQKHQASGPCNAQESSLDNLGTVQPRATSRFGIRKGRRDNVSLGKAV